MTDLQIALTTGIFIIAFINLVVVLIKEINKK
ncbi:putative holin-like toxin [Oceanobacillus salinisoli]|nr:putative holin-like toxin [Oceanobacillus salinisoli]